MDLYTHYVFDEEEQRITATSNTTTIDYISPPFVATTINAPVAITTPYFKKLKKMAQ